MPPTRGPRFKPGTAQASGPAAGVPVSKAGLAEIGAVPAQGLLPSRPCRRYRGRQGGWAWAPSAHSARQLWCAASPLPDAARRLPRSARRDPPGSHAQIGYLVQKLISAGSIPKDDIPGDQAAPGHEIVLEPIQVIMDHSLGDKQARKGQGCRSSDHKRSQGPHKVNGHMQQPARMPVKPAVADDVSVLQKEVGDHMLCLQQQQQHQNVSDRCVQSVIPPCATDDL